MPAVPAEDVVEYIEGVRVYNRALSEEEILTLAEQTNPIKDKSRNGRDGYSAGQLSSVRGVSGKAINFLDKKNFEANLVLTNEGSISIWFRSKASTGHPQSIINQYENDKAQVYLSGTNSWLVIKMGGIDTIIETNFSDDIFHYLVITYDGLKGIVYIDGETQYTTSNLNAFTDNGEGLQIGNVRNSIYVLKEESFIGEAYTNLVQDPTDLTTGNWYIARGITATSSSLTINGLPFTKLTIDGTDDPSIATDYYTKTASSQATASVILKYGSLQPNERSEIYILDRNTIIIGYVAITWDTKTVSGSTGTYKSVWIDDETVKIDIITIVSDATTDGITLRIDPAEDYETDGDYIYATACQLVDNTTTMFPFVDGTHAANVIDKDFTMPDIFAIDMIVEPKFAYDTIATKCIYMWYIDGTHNLRFLYDQAYDKIIFYYIDGGTTSALETFVFDDGTSYTNINQRLRITGFLNLLSGGQDDSRLTVIPLESGSLSSDDIWSATPDIKSSVFETLSIGNQAGAIQADSDFEYLNIYEWDGVKPTITNSNDADTYFANKPEMPLFEFEPKLPIVGDLPNKATKLLSHGYDFNGALDEIRFYDKALTAEEIFTLYEMKTR